MNKQTNKQTISLTDQVATKQVSTGTPCNIEVPLDEYTRNVFKNAYLQSAKKFYNFCDSTVVICDGARGYGGPALSIRQMKDLQGREKQEMLDAGAKYAAMTMKNQ